MLQNKGRIYYLLFIFFYFISFTLIAQVNTAPIANPDVDTVDNNTTLTIPAPGVLLNDSDPEGDVITITQFNVGGTTYSAGSTAVLTEGSLTINADGSFEFIPTNGYSGYVPNIVYTISDGNLSNANILYLTVEVPVTTDLLSAPVITSCNQGYTADGYYKVQYGVSFTNQSIARDSHLNSVVTNIQIFDDLNAIFGNGCIFEIQRGTLGVRNSGLNPIEVSSTTDTTSPLYFPGTSFPPRYTTLNWDTVEFSETDPTPGADGILTGLSPNNILFPGQTLTFYYCVLIDPNCAGTGPIDFTNVVSVTSSRGNPAGSLLLPDFHVSATTVAANIYVVDDNPNDANDNPNDGIMEPSILPDGTYQYTNNIIIKNDGNAVANEVNFNLGLQRFDNNGVTFQTITINQISGTPLNVNTNYDGLTDTKILLPGNSMQSGDVAVFEITFLTSLSSAIVNNGVISYFSQLTRSQTQGPADSEIGFDESVPPNLSIFSFVTWTDAAGFNNLDRYYTASTPTEEPSSNNQCDCTGVGLRFNYNLVLEATKTLESVVTDSQTPEIKELTFSLLIKNNSPNIQIINIQLEENLASTDFCPDSFIEITEMPTVLNASATATLPTFNPAFNGGFGGTPDINIFLGNDGLLNPGDEILIEFKIRVSDDCVGQNIVNFSANDPLNASGGVNSNPVSVAVISDNDQDGISDVIDIDDDNDSIPDIMESNGLDPLGDADNDNIPNYSDLDFGADINNDGIVDLFDFDMDGIPNHFDLDSDNDSIYDIVEAGNGSQDTDNNGMTNNNVGNNGLDDTLEDVDTDLATITYTITNTDTNGNEDYLDIDSDDDGIVDVIEAQPTISYISPDTTDSNDNGVFDVYETLGNLSDVDGDSIPDYQDLNSDDDYYSDLIEAYDIDNDGVANILPSNTDVDNDGLDDAFDNDTTQVNPTNNQVPTDFPNLDTPNTIELDWRELIEINVSIADISVVEGGIFHFLAEIDNFSPTDIIIEITTIDDTAISPDDFAAISTPLIITIPSGSLQASITIDIPTVDDTIYEPNEFFMVNGNVTSNNTVNTDPNAIGTITDNDPKPTIFIQDAEEVEGNDLIFEITLSNQSSTSIFIEFSTVDVSALDGLDYTGIQTFVVEIPPLALNYSLTISSTDDEIYEPTETFNLISIATSDNTSNTNLQNVGSILDNEPYPVLSVSSPIVVEGNDLVFEVYTTPLTYQDIVFNIITEDGTAKNPEDFISKQQQDIVIPALSGGVQISVKTIDDLLDEETEDMKLTAVVTSNTTDNIFAFGIGTILDNDTPNLFSPNGDGLSDYFEIDGMDGYPNFTLQIFDRYGSIVYDYSNNGNLNPFWWDGSYKGKEVPEGVYYYVLDYNDGVSKPTTGFIQLIR